MIPTASRRYRAQQALGDTRFGGYAPSVPPGPQTGEGSRVKRTRVRLGIAFVGVLVLAMLAAPATGSAAIKIARIRYNPPGAETGTNRHLNHEFVVIRNTGQRRVVLTDWTLVERRDTLVFSFPRFRLGAGEGPFRPAEVSVSTASQRLW
jgi:hypothetical protein